MNIVKKGIMGLTALTLVMTTACSDNPTDNSGDDLSSSSIENPLNSSDSKDTTNSGSSSLPVISKTVLTGNITESGMLSASNTYELSGFVYVDSGVTLEIEAGTKIASEGKSALIVMSGAKIIAEGTANNPIVFTSKKANPVSGDWAGVVIYGKAPVSTEDHTQAFEANTSDIFGGEIEDDSTGVFKYVRIEYAGYEVATDKELNGLTLGGVGSKTVISYVQVDEGKDDAFEWFGGNVEVDHLVASNFHDDGFDIDEGYQGKGTNLFALMGDDSDHGIEAGSKAVDPNQITEPSFSDITIVGGGKSSALVRLKNNVSGTFKNMVLYSIGNSSIVKAEGDVTLEKINDGSTDLSNSFYSGTYTEVIESEDEVAIATIDIDLESGTDILAADYSSKGDASSAGAIKAGDLWYAGWTKSIGSFSENISKQTAPLITGNITTDTRLTADITYELSGFVYVEDGATLVIDPGTKIASEGKSALIVMPGAKILAQGTKDMPIIFTSKKATPVSGDWAGVVIYGYAPVSTEDHTQAFEANTSDIFGGDISDDNSGIFKYVRIEYAGYEVATDKELNGLTLGGVGSGTSISYVQVHEGKDDAIEWFGGSANVDHIVVSSYHDDGFDIDEGYAGTGKFMLNIQGVDSDHGIEAGSKAVDPNLITTPTFSNVTIVSSGKGSAAMRLKNNVSGNYEKVVIVAEGTISSLVKAEGDVTLEAINDGSTQLDIFYDGDANVTELVECDDAGAKTILEGFITEAEDALNADYTPKSAAIINAGAGAIISDAWHLDWTTGI